MKNRIIILSVFLNVLLILAACGGAGNVGSTLTPNKLRAYVGAMPGFHGVTGKTTTALDVSIVPKLHAQATTTVSFTGSYSGFCPQLNIPAASSTVLYGGGSVDADGFACGKQWFTDSASAAANASTQLVIGDGTIGPLVAYADGSTATVRVYVRRGEQVIDTGISAHLDGKRGTSTATFPVLDGDSVAVVAESDGTPSRGLQFVLAKE